MAKSLVFVGTYSEPILFGTGQVLHGKGKGIYAFSFDPATGALEPSALTEGVRNSSYLAFDPTRRFLYCVNEFKEFEGKASGAVSAYRIEAASGRLAYLNTVASHGTDPCHLIVDATGRHVLVANFASGSVCVLPVRLDGSLGEASQVIQHAGSSVDPVRQKGPHAHAVAIDKANRFVYVPDLGIDKVLIYQFDAGGINPAGIGPPASVATAPGAGPSPGATSAEVVVFGSLTFRVCGCRALWFAHYDCTRQPPHPVSPAGRKPAPARTVRSSTPTPRSTRPARPSSRRSSSPR